MNHLKETKVIVKSVIFYQKKSCTIKLKAQTSKLDNDDKTVVVMDSPGFLDSENKDDEHCKLHKYITENLLIIITHQVIKY